MKKSIFRALAFTLTVASGTYTVANAQSKDGGKKTTIEVRVTEKKDGKTNTYERNYRIDPLSDAEQKVFIDKVLDSLSVNGMSQKQISISVDEEGGAPRRDSQVLGWHDNGRTFGLDTNELQSSMRQFQQELAPKMRQLQKEMEPKLREFRRDLEPGLNSLRQNLKGMEERYGDTWNKDFGQSSTVRSLNAYANNPDNGMLNLRFSAPDKGDVTITVTDSQGKEVGKKSIPDFSGEFMGQIELKKNTKGSLFVTVTQNEDGAVRKVVVR